MRIPYEIVRKGDDDDCLDVGRLKGCPFCGKADRLVITGRKFYDELVAEHGSAVISIDCKRCSASLGEYSHNYSGKDYSFQAGMLVAKWNNRKEEDEDD